MSTTPAYTDALAEWYRTHARSFFERADPERVAVLDHELERLQKLRDQTSRGEELPICVLGASGVGKSTLLNAIVAKQDALLPQGGVGPLTAQATLVRHAGEPSFRATYLSSKRLGRLLFALEAHHENELKRRKTTIEAKSEELKATLDDEERWEAEADLQVVEEGAPARADDRIEAYKRQARQMIQGSQYGDVDLPYLLDGLHLCLGRAPRWSTTPADEDRGRIERVRKALEIARAKGGGHEVCVGDELRAFREELEMHASGFLAPLIKTLEVRWDAELLRDGLVLVDLPGLGVANDEYRKVTTTWIRKARAVVLVVDRSGVTEASADLLRSTGFLSAMLHDSHDPNAAPVSLLVAVVKLDLSADDARRREQVQRSGTPRRWIEHFEEVCAQAIDLIKGQMRSELEKIAEEGAEATRTERREALARVLQTMEVHPIAALEYRKLYLEDEDDRPRITNAEQSRIPALTTALGKVASDHAARLDARLLRASLDFAERARAAIELCRTQWEQDARAEQEAERLREELEAFLNPLRREFLVRQGGFREFLRSTIPEQIELRIKGEAAVSARAEIDRYLRRFDEYHWATLRATVRRFGAFLGSKHVDLPNELTLRFEEPVAVVWSKHILAALRRRTAALGEDYVQMTAHIVDWALSQGARVQPKLIEALHEELKAETKDLADVGKKAIDELKESVKAELYGKINEQVRRRCQKFIDEKLHQGPGVKQRILHFFREELVASVVEAATAAAVRVLTDNYRVVELEIGELFGRYRNPLDTGAEAIVSSHATSIKRSDAQRRRRVLEEAEGALAALPAAEG